MLTAVTGINWGDEGKGRVIDLDHLSGEMQAIEARGVKISPQNLKLSDKATISMPWHKVQDGLEEDRLAKNGTAFGSTRRGIAYAPLGAGIPNCRLDHVVGVLKAYSTCVGAGPFAAEHAMDDAWNEQLRKAGGEYGAATGRPRRVGPFDCVASRYGLACQGADKIALTKLDVLSSMKEIPVITGYTLDGAEVPRFDPLSDLDRVQPVVTMLPGWNRDISDCTSWDELPEEAKNYVAFLEQQLDHEIQFVSTGAEREKFVLKGEWL